MKTFRNLLRRPVGSRRKSVSRTSTAISRQSAEVLEDRALLSTITVTSADDTTANDGQVTLREAIGAANGDLSIDGSVAGSGIDTIVFDPSLAGQTIELEESELVVTSHMIIDAGAAGIVIDGGSVSRLFRLETGQSLNLVGLTLTGGSSIGVSSLLESVAPAAGSGGAIYSNAGFLTIRDSVLHGNFARGESSAVGLDGQNGYGGAIAAIGGSVSLVNTRLVDNAVEGGTVGGETPTYGTAGDGYGGGLYASDAAVTILGSTVDSNSAGSVPSPSHGRGYGGGASFLRSNASILNSTISRNYGQENGGGIHSDGDSASTLTTSNVTISGNSATRGGGIYQAETGTITIGFTTIFGNSATDAAGGLSNQGLIRIGNSILAGNTAPSNPNVWDSGIDEAFESLGYNIFGDMTGITIAGDNATIQVGVDAATVLNPALLNNGGPTETHALISGSPAIDAALAAAAPTTDQRGMPRPGFDAPDIGAVEVSETEAMDVLASLDITLDLHTTGNLFENWGGLGEKWVKSTSGHWYFIMPSGAMHRWDGTAATASGTLIANLAPVVHTFPDLLYNASATKLDTDLGLHSNGNLYTNWAHADEKWILDANDDWHFILPNGEVRKWDRTPQSATGTLVGSLETKFYDHPNLLIDAHNISHDRWFGFKAGTSDFFNWGGRNEKWFRGSQNAQYFILPGGAVYKWDRSNHATGTFVTTTDATTYSDPSLLHDAVDNVFSDWVGP